MKKPKMSVRKTITQGQKDNDPKSGPKGGESAPNEKNSSKKKRRGNS